MSDGKGVALAILGIVALIAVVGLILLFSGKLTGEVTTSGIGGYGANKLYGNWDKVQEEAPRGAVVAQSELKGGGASYPYSGNYVKGVPYTPEGIPVAVIGGQEADYRISSIQTTCPPGLARMGVRQMQTLSDDNFGRCIAGSFDDGSMCCPVAELQAR